MPRERARLLDEGLSRLAAFWDGEFEPPPVQQPRIPDLGGGALAQPAAVGARARWDGLFPIELPGPEALAELADEIERSVRADAGPFDLVVELDRPATTAGPWAQAGATWVLTGFGRPAPRRGRAGGDRRRAGLDRRGAGLDRGGTLLGRGRRRLGGADHGVGGRLLLARVERCQERVDDGGSNWVPAQRMSSSRAAAGGMPAR